MLPTAEIVAHMKDWRQNLDKDDRWCILINADPDALASAMALKRLLLPRVHNADIARVNEVTRPDNLAMIRYLRIPVRAWQPEKADQYTRFAIVDSQPHHHKAFQGIPSTASLTTTPCRRPRAARSRPCTPLSATSGQGLAPPAPS